MSEDQLTVMLHLLQGHRLQCLPECQAPQWVGGRDTTRQRPSPMSLTALHRARYVSLEPVPGESPTFRVCITAGGISALRALVARQ